MTVSKSDLFCVSHSGGMYFFIEPIGGIRKMRLIRTLWKIR